jgi:hypothetical protein
VPNNSFNADASVAWPSSCLLRCELNACARRGFIQALGIFRVASGIFRVMRKSIINRELIVSAALCICLISLPEARSQIASSSGQDAVSKYVENLVAKFNVEKSLAYRYSGGFNPIPAELEAALAAAFPQHRFKVAVVEYAHYQWHPASILIVQDAATGEALAYCGDVFVFGGQGSESFKEILSSYQAHSKEDALEKVALLAKLIVFPDWRVGKVSMKNKMIEAEFDTGLQTPKRPFRILRVPIDEQHKFGRLAIVNPVSGKEE